MMTSFVRQSHSIYQPENKWQKYKGLGFPIIFSIKNDIKPGKLKTSKFWEPFWNFISANKPLVGIRAGSDVLTA